MAAGWEHRVLTYKLKWKGFDYAQMESDLNELGLEGWETVGTIVPTMGQGQTTDLAVIVKRPRP
jgi:hypothetical protein